MCRRFFSALLAVLLVVPVGTNPAFAQVDVSCGDFDAWPWAQTVLESDPDRYAGALDPDLNGIACESLTIHGFAPVLWTDAIPAGAEPAGVAGVTDGDTIKVTVNGAQDSVRLYHIDTPETSDSNRGQQCGGTQATDFLTYVLGFAPNGIVYLEYDQTERDRYDRRLAYVWFELAGDVYLVNEVMVRNGWAESETYKPDVKYKAQLDAAEQFSVDHVTGVRLLCGKFGQPNDGTATPSKEQVRQAMNNQPHQGQFDAYVAPAQGAAEVPAPIAQQSAEGGEEPAQQVRGDSTEGSGQQIPQPSLEPTPVPNMVEWGQEAVEEPSLPVEPAPTFQDPQCETSYPDFCYDYAWVLGDLDCPDIPFTNFTVYPPDSHGFDGDYDGMGCET